MKQALDLHCKIVASRIKYYREGSSELSDDAYDALVAKFCKVMETYPNLRDCKEFEHTIDVGYASPSHKIEHSKPMLSLSSIKLQEDRDKSIEALKRFFNTIEAVYERPNYVLELKFDGIAVAIRYNNGRFLQAATRGDGFKGEDITKTFKEYAKNVPWVCPIRDHVEIRGELTLKKSLAPKGNARNIVAGLLRGKITEHQVHSLDFFAYSVDALDGFGLAGLQSKRLKFLERSLFEVDAEFRVCQSSEEVLNWIDDFLDRPSFDYDFDGCVIKVDDIATQEALGSTSQFPRWAVALKPQGKGALGCLDRIEFSVGRLGRITPVCILRESITIQGAAIQRISLPHYKRLKELGLSIGDTVEIERAGSVIPILVRKVMSSNNSSEVIDFPKTDSGELCCPCDRKSLLYLSTKDGCTAFCSALDCSLAMGQKARFFASKHCVNISGFGDAVAKLLVERKIVNRFADIFAIRESDLESIPGWKSKKISNLIQAIDVCKKDCSQADVLTGLGLPGLGRQTVRILLENFTTIENVCKASEAELKEILHIGDEAVATIKNKSDWIFKECQAMKDNGVKCFY